jgi:hypothetical protein
MVGKHKAIKALRPDASFALIDNVVVWHDEVQSEPTADEISAKQAEMTQAETDAEAQKATDKANAKAKLIAGEALTEAEADTIVL